MAAHVQCSLLCKKKCTLRHRLRRSLVVWLRRIFIAGAVFCGIQLFLFAWNHSEPTYKIQDYLNVDNFFDFNFRDAKYDAYSNNITSFWEYVRTLVAGDFLYPEEFDVHRVIKALREAKILHADVLKSKTAFSLKLRLDGQQTAIFKVQLRQLPDDCNTGCEYPKNEIIAFTLNRMFNLRNMPFTTGRTLNWFTDIEPVATPELKRLMHIVNGQSVCVAWSCMLQVTQRYCFINGDMTGAMIYELEGERVETLIDSRTRRIYHGFSVLGALRIKDLEIQPGDKTFCNVYRSYSPYQDDAWFLDIVDISVFDYLMTHAKSKHMYISDKTSANIPLYNVMVDFGHAFVESHKVPEKGTRKVQGVPQSQTAALPRHQEEEETDKIKQAQMEQTFCKDSDIRTLAPLMQCCRIRKRLYEAMVKYNDTLPETFDSLTKDDPFYPLIKPEVMDDMRHKLKQILALTDFCMNLEDEDESTVIVDV